MKLDSHRIIDFPGMDIPVSYNPHF